jgi:hypothetical protein
MGDFDALGTKTMVARILCPGDLPGFFGALIRSVCRFSNLGTLS